MYFIALLLVAFQLTVFAASDTPAANPNCPTNFQLVALVTRFQNYYVNVNATGQYNISTTVASNFTLKNNRLITLSSPGGTASVPKGTGPNGAYLKSTSNSVSYDFLDATFDSNCFVVFNKKVSATYTLDRLYSIAGSTYIAPQNNAPSNGFQIAFGARAIGPL